LLIIIRRLLLSLSFLLKQSHLVSQLIDVVPWDPVLLGFLDQEGIVWTEEVNFHIHQFKIELLALLLNRSVNPHSHLLPFVMTEPYHLLSKLGWGDVNACALGSVDLRVGELDVVEEVVKMDQIHRVIRLWGLVNLFKVGEQVMVKGGHTAVLSHVLSLDHLLDHGDGLLVVVATFDGRIVRGLDFNVDEELLIDHIEYALEGGDLRAIPNIELLQLFKGLLKYVLYHSQPLLMYLPVVPAMDHYQHVILGEPYL
jgi:hypothetical protein